MKVFLAVVLLLGWIHPALAESPMPSPLTGRWAVDVSRLPMAPEARPKSVTITFGSAGEGKWSTEVDIVDAAGSENHSKGTATLDGTPASVTGNNEADTAAFRMPAPNVLIMALSKGGIPGSTRIYSVTGDGNSLIETAVYFGDHGVPIMRTHYFTPVR
ncbi:hypothetical protein [Dyella sp. C11]|uniref:hypothetical protein n=1 Tax=Dyella sp. C11 TaxID=2126991 RepID=UPI000D64D597|nr:hypothetical protein [Dyella sp. C11]